MTRAYQQICPIARTLDIVGERWTLLILRDMFRGRTKFNELLEYSPGMPGRLLSDRLKMLEEHGLIERAVYSQHPLRAEYRLTEHGRTLAPVLEAIFRWGIEHTLDRKERDVVLTHLFGQPNPKRLRFPPSDRATQRARASHQLRSASQRER